MYLSLFSLLTGLAIAIMLFFAVGGLAVTAIGFILPYLQSKLVGYFVGQFC